MKMTRKRWTTDCGAGWLCAAASLLLVAGCVLDRSGAPVGAGGGGSGGSGAAGGGGPCVPEQCPAPEPCEVGVCDGDTCAVELAPVGTVCSEPMDMICNAVGACVQALGYPCEADPTVCPLNTSCANGVCCDGVCSGTCEACDLTGTVGYCTPFDAGSNPTSVCTDGVCDGGGECAAGADLWHFMIGDINSQHFTDAAAGDDAAVYFVGSYTFNLALPGMTAVNAAGLRTGVLSRHLPDGNVDWLVEFESLNAKVDGVSVRGNDVFVTGTYDGTLTVDSQPYPSVGIGTDIFVAKFSIGGQLAWLKTFGGDGYDYAVRLAADAAGNVVMAGYSYGGMTIGAALPYANLGGEDAFVIKLDADGNVVWSRWFGGPGDQNIWDIDVNEAGDVAIAGEMSEAFDPGTGNGMLPYAGGLDSWAARLSVDNTFSWIRSYGGTGDDVGYAVRFTESGTSVAFGGFFTSGIAFGLTPDAQFGTDSGKQDAFFVFLGGAGSFLSGVQLGVGNRDEEIWEVERTKNGGWVLGGSYEHNWTIAPDIMLPDNGGNLEAFVLKLGNDLTPLWARAVAAANGGTPDELWGLAVDPNNNVIFTAAPAGDFDWFGAQQVYGGGKDIFIAKLAP